MGGVVLNQGEARGMLALGSAIVQSGDPTAPDVIAASRRIMIPLLFVMRGHTGGQPIKTDILEVFVEDLRTLGAHPSVMDFATAVDSVFRSLGMPMNVTGTPTKTNIGGREFAKFDSILRVNDDASHITDYATMTKGFILTFQMLARIPTNSKSSHPR